MPGNWRSLVRRAQEEFKRREQVNPGFIKTFSKSEGYPVWHRSVAESYSAPNTLNITESTDSLLFIPVVRDGEDYVSSFITVRIIDSAN